MPDNVSLSVSDINDLKNSTDLAINLLDKKSFVFDSADASDPKKLGLVGNKEDSIKIFTAIKKVEMTSNSKTVTVPLKYMASKITPSVQVTVSGDSNLAKYRLSTSVEVTKEKVIIYIEANPKTGLKINAGSSKLHFSLNVLAIGYA
jgi:hypothetical protein